MDKILNFELLTFLMAFVFALLVILIVLALFFKNSKLKIKDWFQLETVSKDCKQVQNKEYKEFENTLVANAVKNDNKLEYLNNKTIDDIKANYNNIIDIKDETTDLCIYKEYSVIVFNTSFKVLFQLFEFLKENHITQKKPTEITLLAKERAKELIALYDEAFKKSSYSSIQTLTIEKLSGTFYHIIKILLKETYLEIYRNHARNLEDRKHNIDDFIKNNQYMKCNLKLIGIQPIMEDTFSNTYNTNNLILSSMATDIINILLGLFYDKLKD